MDIFVIFLVFFSFFLAGERISQAWELRFSTPAESIVFATGLGLLGVTSLTTLLAFLGGVYPITPWIILALINLICVRRLIHLVRNALTRLKTPNINLSKPTWFAGFNGLALGILIFLALTLALSPAIKTDALVYHLAVAKTFLEHHGVTPLPDNIYSFFPLQTEMLYLFCFALRGEALAQLAGLGVSLLLLLAMTQYYRQTFSPRLALCVPVVYFSTHTFFFTAPAAYVDMPVATFIFLTFFAWDRWKHHKQNGWFYCMVIFAGAAVASKLTAVIVLPLVFLAIVLQTKEPGEIVKLVKRVFILALAVAFFVFPWWGRNYFYTGNPFVPYFMQFFGGESGINWDVSRSIMQLQYYHAFGMGRGLWDFLLLPYNLTFASEIGSLRFDGEIGILYILFLPALFAFNRRLLPIGVVFVTLLIFWFINFQYIRLLTPAFAFFSIICVACLEGMIDPKIELYPWNPSRKIRDRMHLAGRALIFVLSLGVLSNMASIVEQWRRLNPLSYLLHQETRDRYLSRHLPSYPLFQTINTKLDNDAVVLFIYMRNFGYLSDRKFISDTFFEAHTLQQILKRNPSIDGISRQLNDLGVTHLLFDNRYFFGKDSAFSPEDRESLRNFINARAQLEIQKNGYYLYRFMIK